MTEYCWIFLTVPENAEINCSEYAKILNMPQYNNKNIVIIVTNVIVLEFLPAWFIHIVALRVKTE